MTKEEVNEIPPEERVWQLKDQIIEKLKEKGGDPTRRFQAVGTDVVRVVSNEWTGENSKSNALCLDIAGNWSGKFDMSGYPIPNPSIETLLGEYAYIKDSDYFSITLQSDFVSNYSKVKQEQLAFVQSNKNKLLTGFISSLEATLQELR